MVADGMGLREALQSVNYRPVFPWSLVADCSSKLDPNPDCMTPCDSRASERVLGSTCSRSSGIMLNSARLKHGQQRFCFSAILLPFGRDNIIHALAL